MNDDSIETICEAARGYTDPAEREAYLDRACKDNALLRAQVDHHLSASGDDEDEFFLHDDLNFEKAGDVIARYRLVERLGQGGFGVVWKAEQFEPIRREVALKIIKVGMDTRQVVARFDQERQALALMDHPSIARVIDGGATSSGRPYFVMDLVRGEPMTAFCDRQRLSIEDRLKLFVQVCAAIQHAHSKGIIHRDLKPTNILVGLVDGEPHATVIDFGIAKAMTEKLTELTLVTAERQVIGTLQYMSPEQAAGSLDVDTRTDVYALGVILYEILTGTTPFDEDTIRGVMFHEVQRMICELDPPPPSLRLTTSRDLHAPASSARRSDPKRLIAMLRGELDWMVMKAIEKEPARRYDTAADFLADVRRYLSSEPVLAAPPSRAYRLRKFVTRNKGLVTAASLVLVALIVGIIGTTWGMLRAEEETRRAERATTREAVGRQQAEAVADLLQGIWAGVNPYARAESGLSLEDQMVTAVVEAADRLASMDGDPDLEMKLTEAIASSLGALSQYEKAAQLLEPLLVMQRDRLGAEDASTRHSALMLSATYSHLGRFEDAMALLDPDAVLHDAESADDWNADQAYATGMILRESQQPERAVPIFERLAAQSVARNEDRTPDGLHQRHALGAIYRQVGRYAEAIDILEDVRSGREEVLGRTHPDTLMTMNSLTVALSECGRIEEATALGEETIARMLERYSADHASVLGARMNLIACYAKSGRADDAVALGEQIATMSRQTHGAKNPTTLRIELHLVSAYVAAARFDDAIELGLAAIPNVVAVYGLDSPMVDGMIPNLTTAAIKASRPDDLIGLIERLHADAVRFHGAESRAALRGKARLAKTLRAFGRNKAAVDVFAEVFEAQTRLLGADDLDRLDTGTYLAATYFSLRDGDAAIAAFEEILPRQERVLGERHRETLRTRSSLAAAYWTKGQLDRSIPLMESTLAMQREVLGDRNGDVLSTVENLCVNYGDAKMSDRLIDHTLEWHATLLATKGFENPMLNEIVARFDDACRATNRWTDRIPLLDGVRSASVERFGTDSPRVFRSSIELAEGLARVGKFARAVALGKEIVQLAGVIHGELSPQKSQVTLLLASILSEAGHLEESVDLVRSRIEQVQRSDDVDKVTLGMLRRGLAEALTHAGLVGEAETIWRAELADVQGAGDGQTLRRQGIKASLGICLIKADRHEEAEAVLREVVAVRERLIPKRWQSYNAQALLGLALLVQGRLVEAEPFLDGGCRGLLDQQAGLPWPSLNRVAELLANAAEVHVRLNAANPDPRHEQRAAEWRQHLLEFRRRYRPSED